MAVVEVAYLVGAMEKSLVAAKVDLMVVMDYLTVSTGVANLAYEKVDMKDIDLVEALAVKMAVNFVVF